MKGNSGFTTISGTVTEALPNTMFRVEVGEGQIILATLKGSLRRRYVRIFPGDKVIVEMTRYDKERGRIVQKLRS
ncbi:MAG: Translation initiation factor IF-1 [candidate division WWE3 bacterium GW2011_GWB1_42_6]|uniref:Translation initiation factor IF-1 n=1 Tax=candidate division WWE3 bacterium GW2011_GWB1_42_6 TaxID=1619115 RepID=A0A0G1D437_UNCKA|nr:MAG: Translation initiation factor IF-1 [candidate division WWE3 bacterium GW2011_GWB1_42_6]